MKTITLTLSFLAMLSVPVMAEDLADFVSKEKTYTVRLSDGQRFYGVEFRKWRAGTDWGQISYSRHRNASTSRNQPLPQGLESRLNPGLTWINFNQVTSIREVEKAEDAKDGASDASQSTPFPPEVDIEVDETADDNEGSGDEQQDKGGLEAIASGGVIGGEAGGLIGRVHADESGNGTAAAGALAGALIDTDAAPDRQAASPAVIKRLNGIASIRERVVKHQESLLVAGRVSRLELIKSQIALIESRIDLAEAEGQFDRIAEQLRHLIMIQRERAKVAREQFAAGGSDETEVAEAEIALLKTEIRLLRLEE